LRLERGVDAIDELIGVEGLGQEIDRAFADRGDRGVHRRLAGDDDGARGGLIVLEVRQQIGTQPIGQVDVGDHQLHALGL
jgi:hypothetical protein